MLLEEANERLKTVQLTEEQLWQINNLYCLLDLDKDDFCKIVDAVGFDKLAAKQEHYKWLAEAECDLKAKERYLKAKTRLKELDVEKQQLIEIVDGYKQTQRQLGKVIV